MLNKKTVMISILSSMAMSCAHKPTVLGGQARVVAGQELTGTETGNPIGVVSVLVRPDGSVELSGEEAKMFKSIFGTKKFQSDGFRGFKNVVCESDKCIVKMDRGGIYRSNRDEYSGNLSSGPGEDFINKSDFVETNFSKISFYKDLPERDGEKFFVTPSGAYYYHDREDVLKNDKKIYELMKKSKSSYVNETISGDKTILRAQTNSIKMTCYKTDNPLEASAGNFTSKRIKLKYSCRTYFKAQATPLEAPIIVNTRDARTEVYKLADDKSTIPAKGVKVRQIIDPNPKMVTGGTKQLISYTDDAGGVQNDKEIILSYSDYKTEEASLVVKVEVNEYALKMAEIQKCKNQIDTRSFVNSITVDVHTNTVVKYGDSNTACGTDYKGTLGLKAGMNYPQMQKHPKVYEKGKSGKMEYVVKPEVELKCVLIGTAVYPTSGIDVEKLESFDSGIARMKAACN